MDFNCGNGTLSFVSLCFYSLKFEVQYFTKIDYLFGKLKYLKLNLSFFIFQVQVKGWCAVFRIELKKVSMCHFKEIVNGCKNNISVWGVPKLLFGRTSFPGMLKAVLREPLFRDQPYFTLLYLLSYLLTLPY